MKKTTIKTPYWLYILLFIIVPVFSFYSCNMKQCKDGGKMEIITSPNNKLEKCTCIDTSLNNGDEVCPDCGFVNCIYQQIDKQYDESSDTSILNTIYRVCKVRGISDSATIELIKSN